MTSSPKPAGTVAEKLPSAAAVTDATAAVAPVVVSADSMLTVAADAGGEVQHRVQQPGRRGGVAAGDVALGPLTGQHRPQVSGPGVGRRPGRAGRRAAGLAGLVAVAVAVRAALRG